MSGVLIGAITAAVYFGGHYLFSVRERLRLERRIDELEDLLQDRTEQRRR